MVTANILSQSLLYGEGRRVKSRLSDKHMLASSDQGVSLLFWSVKLGTWVSSQERHRCFLRKELRGILMNSVALSHI